MFCNQCEQIFPPTGCANSLGVCGESADVQSLQELLLYGLKGIAACADQARRLGKYEKAVSVFIEALLATMINVNFDEGSAARLLPAMRHDAPAGHAPARQKPLGHILRHTANPGDREYRRRAGDFGHWTICSICGICAHRCAASTSRLIPTARCCWRMCICNFKNI